MAAHLRPYQQECIDKLREKIALGFRAPLLALQTGAGKTVIGATIAKMHVDMGGRVLWLAHRRELIIQSAEVLRSLGLRVGEICPKGKTLFNDQVRVASIQTLLPSQGSNRFDATMVVWDEIHHAGSDEWSSVLTPHPNAYLIGLTATPCRADGRGLSPPCDSMVVGPSILELTEMGHLVPCEVIAPSKPLDARQLAQSPVAAYQAHAEGRSTVVFAERVDDALRFGIEFGNQGIRYAVVHGGLDPEARMAALAAHAFGAVLINCMVLTEGWDCLDEQTEILTPNGWKRRGEIRVGDYTHSLNIETGLLEVVPVIGVTDRICVPSDQWTTIKSQHVDIRTTASHNFFIKIPKGEKRSLPKSFEKVTGQDLHDRRRPYALPIAARPDDPPRGIDLSDDEIRFVAWFMTDGGFCGPSVCINQAKQEYVSEIRTMLLAIGLDFIERVRNPGHGGYGNSLPLHEFRIPKGTDYGSKQRAGWGRRFEGLLDKNVATPLHDMSLRQFQVFWTEALKGDGQRSPGKNGWLWCDRIAQADAYERMAIERGLSTSHKKYTTANGHEMYRVSVRSAQWVTTDPRDARSARTSLSPSVDGERVWCVTNRNGTIVVRRNGKVAIVGNSPTTSCCILARGCGHVGTYLQIVGRILRPHPTKRSALLIDLTGRASSAHGHPADPRVFSLSGKGIRRNTADDFRFCAVCGSLLDDEGKCDICGHVAEGATEIRVLNTPMVRYAKKRAEDAPQRAETLRRWQNEGRKQGYKFSWALVKYRAVYGEYPSAEVKKLAQ